MSNGAGKRRRRRHRHTVTLPIHNDSMNVVDYRNTKLTIVIWCRHKLRYRNTVPLPFLSAVAALPYRITAPSQFYGTILRRCCHFPVPSQFYGTVIRCHRRFSILRCSTSCLRYGFGIFSCQLISCHLVHVLVRVR